MNAAAITSTPDSMTPIAQTARLEKLRQRRDQLSVDLAREAQELRRTGKPPSADLLEHILLFQQELHELQREILGENQASSVPRSLNELVEIELRIQFSHEQRKELEYLLELRHTDDPTFSPLAKVHEETRQLLTALNKRLPGKVHPELQRYQQSTHPLKALAKLVSEQNMSDKDWAEWNEHVVASYGRGLSAAVARGRIMHRPSAQNEPASPQAKLEITSSVLTTEASVFAAGHEDRNANPDARPLPAVEEKKITPPRFSHPQPRLVSPNPVASPRNTISGSREEDHIFESLEPARGTGSSVRLHVVPSSTPPAQKDTAKLCSQTLISGLATESQITRDLAQLARQTTTTHRPVVLRELICQLLLDDRGGMAYHLTNALEARQIASFPAGWLIEALVLARPLCFAKGSLARRVETLLQKFRGEMLSAGNAEEQLSAGMLLRATALIPALFAASPSAIAILRSFKITPGFSHLYNYCSKVAAYGPKLQGHLLDLWPAQELPADCSHELDALQHSAREWLQSQQQTLPYRKATPLFQHAHWTISTHSANRHPDATQSWVKWHETLRIASRLILPILEDNAGARGAVKHELERLARGLSNERIPTNSDLSALTSEMQATLHCAMDFAGRWLRLAGIQSSVSQPLVTHDLEDLRREILQRTGPVLTELRGFGQQQTSRLVRASISMLCRSVERLAELFNPETPPPLREPEPRHLLHGDLLQLPQIILDEHWQPRIDPLVLEQEILTHLGESHRDWKTAFHRELAQGNYATTARMLELNVWSSEHLRQQLRDDHERCLQVDRQRLQQLLSEIETQLEFANRLQLADEPELFGLHQRWEQLQQALPNSYDLHESEQQIEQLRRQLARKPWPAYSGNTMAKQPAMRPLMQFALPNVSFNTLEPGLEDIARGKPDESQHDTGSWALDLD